MIGCRGLGLSTGGPACCDITVECWLHDSPHVLSRIYLPASFTHGVNSAEAQLVHLLLLWPCCLQGFECGT
jgi:hypothetical protein